jgi:hypothetical protein
VAIGKLNFITKIAIALIVALAVFFALVYTDWHRAGVQRVPLPPPQQQQQLQPLQPGYPVFPEPEFPQPKTAEPKPFEEQFKEDYWHYLEGK